MEQLLSVICPALIEIKTFNALLTGLTFGIS